MSALDDAGPLALRLALVLDKIAHARGIAEVFTRGAFDPEISAELDRLIECESEAAALLAGVGRAA